MSDELQPEAESLGTLRTMELVDNEDELQTAAESLGTMHIMEPADNEDELNEAFAGGNVCKDGR